MAKLSIRIHAYESNIFGGRKEEGIIANLFNNYTPHLQLSAENFKLKEQLSREKYANEISRKAIIAEVEEKLDKGAVFADAAHARREVLQQEIIDSGILSATIHQPRTPGKL